MTPLEHLAFAEAALMTDQGTAAWAAIQHIRKASAQLVHEKPVNQSPNAATEDRGD